MYQDWWDNLTDGKAATLEDVYEWSCRRYRAELAVRKGLSGRYEAAESHVQRMAKLETLCQNWSKDGRLAVQRLTEVSFYRLDAEIEASQIKAELGRDKAVGSEKPHARLQAAQATFERMWGWFLSGYGVSDSLYDWSVRWRSAAFALATGKADRIAATEGHVARMKQLQKVIENRQGGRGPSAYASWQADFYCAEAEILLAKARAE